MLDIYNEKGVAIARFKNISRFNSVVSQYVKDELNAIMKQHGAKLIISFEEIRFIDSSAFGTLISVLKMAKENKGTLRLCNMSMEVMELMEVMQLHTVFDIYGTVDDALSGI